VSERYGICKACIRKTTECGLCGDTGMSGDIMDHLDRYALSSARSRVKEISLKEVLEYAVKCFVSSQSSSKKEEYQNES
jgi:hypothetical protein